MAKRINHYWVVRGGEQIDGINLCEDCAREHNETQDTTVANNGEAHRLATECEDCGCERAFAPKRIALGHYRAMTGAEEMFTVNLCNDCKKDWTDSGMQHLERIGASGEEHQECEDCGRKAGWH